MNRKERRIAEAQGKKGPSPALLAQAVALHQAGRLADAETIYNSLLAQSPDSADVLGLLGALRLQKGDHREAFALLKRSARLNPRDINVQHNLGYLLDAMGQYAEAIVCFDKAIALDARFAPSHHSKGNALNSLARYAEALPFFDTAIAINPDYADAHNSHAYTLINLRRFEEALVSADRAIALNPRYAEAYFNKATVCAELKRHDEATEHFDKAIALKADYRDAYWNKSMSRLVLGDYKTGWKLFEWRWQKPEMQAEVRAFHIPQWYGDAPVAGKRIWVHAEQGLGDTLQFCRYLPKLAAMGAQIILEAPESLHSLLAGVEPSMQIISVKMPLPECDLRCPLMSLPLAFGTTLGTIPSEPYLKAQPEFVEKWKPLLNEKLGEGTFRVGLCWAGGQRIGMRNVEAVDGRRSVHFDQLKPLLDVAGVSFVSLQLGGPEKQLDDERVKDISAELKNWSDTAAVVSLLNLVITVDTSVCHLAAGMGKRTFMLNRYDTCWRWLLEREDSPWYPTLTQFRQQKPGEWEPVIERVTAELARACVET